MNNEMQIVVEELIGQYGWMVLTIVFGFLFKESIVNAVKGFLIFLGNDFNNDDVIYISGREARIVRVGFRKTVFYMTDRGTKMVVPNEQLKALTMEKVLPPRLGHNLEKDNTVADKSNEKKVLHD